MLKNVISTSVVVLLFLTPATSQTHEVAITIDDVPNVSLPQRTDYPSELLAHIDSFNLPVAIFINEKNLFRTGTMEANRSKLQAWLRYENISIGNHSYSHFNYGDTSLIAFQQDVLKGEIVTRELTQKPIQYFRFPFNSLGRDSLAHHTIINFLEVQGYTIAPFTIESEDWAFNSKYENAIKSGHLSDALAIGQQYLDHTLALFEYFETLSVRLYGRNIKHIYLCHDNRLNTDYLIPLIKRLQQKGYEFISLAESLNDPIYTSRDYYFGNYGFSWIYRWQDDADQRKMMMRNEPRNKFLD